MNAWTGKVYGLYDVQGNLLDTTIDLMSCLMKANNLFAMKDVGQEYVIDYVDESQLAEMRKTEFNMVESLGSQIHPELLSRENLPMRVTYEIARQYDRYNYVI